MIINLLHTAALGICAGSKLVDRNEVKNIRAENDLRRSKLSELEQHKEAIRKFNKNMAR